MQKRSRKIFRLSTFTTARNGFSLFSGCPWVCFSFFLFVFSSGLLANHFQPANERSQQKVNLVFLYSNRKSPFPKFRSLYVVVWKVISPIFFPLKSARNCPPSKRPKASKFSLTDKSKSREEADSSSKIFQQQIRLFPFFTMPPNDRGYGHGRFAGVFAVAQRQSECGRKTR